MITSPCRFVHRMLRVPAAIAAGFIFCSCSVHVGSTIEVPDVPAPTISQETKKSLDLDVSLGTIKDMRSTSAEPASEDSPERYTEPQGDVGQVVKGALQNAFAQCGIRARSDAALSVWGEVRRWRTKVITKSTSSIKSEAALYIEVVDRSGTRVYSGTYHGVRASEFPVASLSDIRESLGLAMTQAIEQLLDDEEFITALWRRH
jgi:hypothetical protein